ncbi:hypothetical protein DRQ53_03070 [bacterium]|nr:MAG: hypothetical protein DRQ53_03070 [bacterium]
MLSWPRSLFWSLTASIIGVLALTALLQVLFAFVVVEPIVRARQGSQAVELIASAAPELERVARAGDPQLMVPVLSRYQRLAEGLLLAFKPVDGPVILPGPQGRHSRRPGFARGERRPLVKDLSVLARQDVVVDGRPIGEILVYRARPGIAISHWLPLRWVFLLPLSFIAAALGGMWIFRRLQRRISALEEHARAVGEGDLGARIADPGDDELGRLGQQLNSMTASLASARAQLDSMESERKRLLADITHELTTPLTSVRGYAETLLDGIVDVDAEQRARYLRDILHASERMRLLIDDLLDLARLEGGGAQLQLESLDLVALVRNSLERHRSRFESAGLTLTFASTQEQLAVSADGRRLEQVVDNLIENELRHVPSGGTVEVAVSSDTEIAQLVVADDGPGFSADAVAHVFERFYRAEASRSTPGSGLGLAIVREIALRHGGSVEAANRAAGGAKLTLRLPLAC